MLEDTYGLDMASPLDETRTSRRALEQQTRVVAGVDAFRA